MVLQVGGAAGPRTPGSGPISIFPSLAYSFDSTTSILICARCKLSDITIELSQDLTCPTATCGFRP